MGLLKKLKNIFYDEEVIEVPVQNKEEKKPKIEEVVLPKRDVVVESPKKETSFSERELFKSETTFNFPIFEDEEEIKPKSRSNVLNLEEREYKSSSPLKETKVDQRAFKPSPVISPIYGILDKNYKKEAIVEKREVNRPSNTKAELSYDYIRHKAYGTLEDELENTITKIQDTDTIEENITVNIQKSADDIEDLLSKIQKNATIGDLEEAEKLREDLEEEKKQKIPTRQAKKEINYDSTLEHDLFNLIDSMYEDRED